MGRRQRYGEECGRMGVLGWSGKMWWWAWLLGLAGLGRGEEAACAIKTGLDAGVAARWKELVTVYRGGSNCGLCSKAKEVEAWLTAVEEAAERCEKSTDHECHKIAGSSLTFAKADGLPLPESLGYEHRSR